MDIFETLPLVEGGAGIPIIVIIAALFYFLTNIDNNTKQQQPPPKKPIDYSKPLPPNPEAAKKLAAQTESFKHRRKH